MGKEEDKSKRKGKRTMFPACPLKRQGDIVLTDFALTGHHSLEYFTTRQGKESQAAGEREHFKANKCREFSFFKKIFLANHPKPMQL